MSQPAPGRFPYDLTTITQHAPPMPGVYAIFSPSECIYVGASEDVCASLLEIYYEDHPCLNDEYLTHFTVDLVASESRTARQRDRIREFQPVCNLRAGSPDCDHCPMAQGKEPRALPAAHGASRH